jgi:hypothetical protein
MKAAIASPEGGRRVRELGFEERGLVASMKVLRTFHGEVYAAFGDVI